MLCRTLRLKDRSTYPRSHLDKSKLLGLGGQYTVLPNTLTIVQVSKLELTWFDDFASRVLDNNLSPIQVFDQKLAATQRFHQPDLVVYEQIISISLEGLKLRKITDKMAVLSFMKAE